MAGVVLLVRRLHTLPVTARQRGLETLTRHELLIVPSIAGEDCRSVIVRKSADFIEIDRNLFDAAPDDLAGIRVEQTWFAGRRVFTR